MTTEALIAAALVPDKVAAARIVADVVVGEMTEDGMDLYKAYAKYEKQVYQRQMDKLFPLTGKCTDAEFLALQLDVTQFDSTAVC